MSFVIFKGMVKVDFFNIRPYVFCICDSNDALLNNALKKYNI